MIPRFCPYCRYDLQRGVAVANDLSDIRCNNCKRVIDIEWTIIHAELAKGPGFVLLLGIEAFKTAAYTGKNPKE